MAFLYSHIGKGDTKDFVFVPVGFGFSYIKRKRCFLGHIFVWTEHPNQGVCTGCLN